MDNGERARSLMATEKSLAPESIWRLRAIVLAVMFSSLSIELVAKMIRDTGADLLSRSLSLCALILLCGAAVYLISLLSGRFALKLTVLLATAVLLISQILSIMRALPRSSAMDPTVLEWVRDIEGVFLLVGILLLLTGFYLALVETVWVKAMLRLEHQDLQNQIIERMRVEGQLRDSRDELRRLSAHVEVVREEERARLARELHDELGQDLTSLRIDAASLTKQLEATAASDAQTEEILASMLQQMDSMVKVTRRIITDLHPAVLDDLGLSAAVEWLIADFQKRTNVNCAMKLNTGDIKFGRSKSTALFRIVQESLTNVARHAKATNVEIRLEANNGHVVLIVSDDGQGIENRNGSPVRKTFGLTGMRERALLLGGEFAVVSSPGAGTVISVKVPTGGAEEDE